MHNYRFLNFFKWCMNLTQSEHLVSLLGVCMSLLDKCKWYVLETTAKLNHWVKSTYFFFSAGSDSRIQSVPCWKGNYTSIVEVLNGHHIAWFQLIIFYDLCSQMLCWDPRMLQSQLYCHRNALKYHQLNFKVLLKFSACTWSKAKSWGW